MIWDVNAPTRTQLLYGMQCRARQPLRLTRQKTGFVEEGQLQMHLACRCMDQRLNGEGR